MIKFAKLVIVTGPNGAGKTNLALNLAHKFAAAGDRTALVDLDVVKSYFRAADFARGLPPKLTLVASDYAGSSLDIPAVTPRVRAVFGGGFDRVIFDVGGDGAGAAALGAFASRIRKEPHEVIYLINRYRPASAEPEAAAAMLREIESASRIRAASLVNASNLGAETAAADIAATADWARECANLCGLPLKCTLLPPGINREELAAQEPLMPVSVFVKKPWD